MTLFILRITWRILMWWAWLERVFRRLVRKSTTPVDAGCYHPCRRIPDMLNVTCTNEEKVPITATPQTADGQPAKVDGALRVSVESGDGSVEQDENDPLSFNAVSGEAAGDTVFVVEADADLGEGTVTISDRVTLTVTVDEPQASEVGLTAGDPIPK